MATVDSSLCDALRREASLRAALEALSAAWREEREQRGQAALQAVHDRPGPAGIAGTAKQTWPEDVDGRTWKVR